MASNTSASLSSDVIVFKRPHFYAAISMVTFVLGLALGYLFWGARPLAAVAATEGSAVVPSVMPVDRLIVGAGSNLALGPEGAPITIVEFSDYQCPFCRQFHEETFQSLLDAYPDQIRFVYRDFPLTGSHPEAQPAAEAARCASDQGKFWDYHHALFENQESLGPGLYMEIATTLRLDRETFESCMNSGRHTDEVLADTFDGLNLGLEGTPTFFINGRRLVGAQPLSAFTAIIDEELAVGR